MSGAEAAAEGEVEAAAEGEVEVPGAHPRVPQAGTWPSCRGSVPAAAGMAASQKIFGSGPAMPNHQQESQA